MILVKWKKNTIFEAIVAAELDPRHFDLDDSEADWRLAHVDSGSKIVIGEKGAHYAGTSLIAEEAMAWPFDAYS